MARKSAPYFGVFGSVGSPFKTRKRDESPLNLDMRMCGRLISSLSG
jgi:hypothetical protein